MWVQVLELRGDIILGTLANDPDMEIALSFGDPVESRVGDVEDWIVDDHKGHVIGGFSLRALEELQNSESQR